MDKIKLPARKTSDKVNVGYALQKRTSCRNYENKSISLQQLANLLWAGQGVISQSFNERRTAPSAGATFPLEIFVAVRKEGVDGVDQGIYQYSPQEHSLKQINEKDVTTKLVGACFGQDFIQNAGANLLISADFERTKERYASRGERYVYMEAGSVTQNISLEAVELGLGTVIVGAFDDDAVKKIFELEEWFPLAVMPVGQPKDKKLYA
ncbi:MAG: SagB/ThcOx family dehydrogenase [Bacteroidales bacterium]|nr:SagB/ThcOx family dehydrogenase [Bacteroidales bacterium]